MNTQRPVVEDYPCLVHAAFFFSKQEVEEWLNFETPVLLASHLYILLYMEKLKSWFSYLLSHELSTLLLKKLKKLQGSFSKKWIPTLEERFAIQRKRRCRGSNPGLTQVTRREYLPLYYNNSLFRGYIAMVSWKLQESWLLELRSF